MAQDRAGELGEEALDEVEPRTVLWCESELETTGRLSPVVSAAGASAIRIAFALRLSSGASLNMAHIGGGRVLLRELTRRQRGKGNSARGAT